MKISVITPSFNQGRFISKCLQSVRDQNGTFAVEHIILDNCSSDSTPDHLAAYRENPGGVQVRVFVEPDDGQTAAINRGFRMAQGDILCWLNTDEWYVENALSRVVDIFESDPSLDMLFGQCNFVDSERNPVGRRREYFYSKNMLIYYGCYIPSCATFVRRRVIDDGLSLDPAFKVCMDLDWYLRIAQAGYRIANVPEPLGCFTWHEANISSTLVDRRILEENRVLNRHSVVRGPSWFRTGVHRLLKVFWIGIRVLRRALA